MSIKIGEVCGSEKRKMPRGRPCFLKKREFIAAIKRYSDRIVVNRRVASKSNSVWKEVAIFLGNTYKATSLCTFVAVNKYGVLDMILKNRKYSADESVVPESTKVWRMSSDDSVNDEKENSKHCVSSKECGHRSRTGEWKTKRLHESSKPTCDTDFKNRRLSTDGSSKHVQGEFIYNMNLCICYTTEHALIGILIIKYRKNLMKAE